MYTQDQHNKDKSPRGLNAYLNLRKLPVMYLGVCHQLEPFEQL